MSTERRQRQKQARQARREAERKAAARREMIRRIGIALAFGVVVAAVLLINAALSGDDEAELPPAYAAFRQQPTACNAEPPPPATEMRFDEPADQSLSEPVTATIRTSCGDLTIEIDPAFAPNTANSFVFLARQGFYDGTVFHRIAENFVIQGGDPLASGTGGPGYTLSDEFPQAGFAYRRGVVAMAKAAGPNTTGSQFFVVTGPNAEALSPTFNVLGEVTDGLDTLDRIAAVPTARQPSSVEQSKPLESVYIEAIDITEG